MEEKPDTVAIEAAELEERIREVYEDFIDLLQIRHDEAYEADSSEAIEDAAATIVISYLAKKSRIGMSEEQLKFVDSMASAMEIGYAEESADDKAVEEASPEASENESESQEEHFDSGDDSGPQAA